jgi:hypothetical protein
MKRETRFDDIHPYWDEEIPDTMRRITESRFFPALVSFVFPDENVASVKEKMLGFRTIYDFQSSIMSEVNRQIIARSITDLTYEGLEKLNPEKKYLFIGNHRDIVLDPCLLMYILYLNGHDTGEITFGSNLMQGELVIDIGKSNKMFRVERSGNPRDIYKNSVHLSEYIRYVITEKRESVWIAQRNGRTKDGVDRTDQGVIKMFGMSGPKDRVEALSELNIVPVSVSYEWEPCDTLKTLEIYATGNGKPYVKRPGEDMNSILTGILQEKGRVHFQICEPLKRDELEAFKDMPHSQFHRSVAKLIDRRICGGYRLFPNAYIAHDIRYGKAEYADRYTKEQYDAFLNHMARLYDINANDVLKDIFLGIYCNPIASK